MIILEYFFYFSIKMGGWGGGGDQVMQRCISYVTGVSN